MFDVAAHQGEFVKVNDACSRGLDVAVECAGKVERVAVSDEDVAINLDPPSVRSAGEDCARANNIDVIIRATLIIRIADGIALAVFIIGACRTG